MAVSVSVFKQVHDRQYQEHHNVSFQRSAQVTPDLVSRIGLEVELEGHNGCVNCLEWNHKGTLLASGSDDTQVILWDPFKQTARTSFRSGHTGNVFSVKFLPETNDTMLVTGAADCRIAVHDLNVMETTSSYTSHAGRVKRIATAPDVPFMFWSASEDGTVMQFDLREQHSPNEPNPQNVLINLNAYMGSRAEVKCIAINPLRPNLIAVGANDPYVRIYDRRMLTCHSLTYNRDTMPRFSMEQDNFLYMLSTADFTLPDGAVQYYVAGHLPQKQPDYRKKYRTLASTYLTFSPDGRELLVNLGGEQIYLFDINNCHKAEKFSIPLIAHTNGVVKEASCTNGYHLPCNGTTPTVVGALSKSASAGASKKSSRARFVGKPLPPAVEAIKKRANEVFEKQQYHQAILLYNTAIAKAPQSAVLYGNRAAAYMKRGWDGDLYAALRDCHSAIRLDRDHLKAHFRLAKCLFELSWTKEAAECLSFFKSKFPDYATSNACESLDRDIKAAIFSKTDHDEEVDKSSDGDKSNSLTGRLYKPKENMLEKEKQLKENACDYELRFCGHCNTTTDIKEANFFGSNGQYIVAGSDDGSFFLWEKSTTNIVRVLRGDDSIVNCLQPHPTACILATSGIDPVVRLWSPRPEDGKKDEREVDNSDDAASANQRRMNADPLEVMLMNMGYRITGLTDGDDDDDRESNERSVQCHPS